MQLTITSLCHNHEDTSTSESGTSRAIRQRLCRAFLSHVVLAFVIFVQLGRPSDLAAQSCASYSNFQTVPDAQLKTLQVKLTYVGISNALMSSFVFTTAGNAPDLSLFALCAPEGFSDPQPTTFAASIAELRALLTNVGTLPSVIAGGVAADQYLAFSLANSQPTKEAFGVILNKSASADLFIQLRKSLATNKTATLGLSSMACSLGLNEPGTPTDITAGVKISMSGVRLNRATRTYVGTMTVTNSSSSTPAAPVSVALDLPINVTIAKPDGITCLTTPPGRGFVNLSSIPSPGQSVSVPIEFNNPDQEPLKFQSKVFAGPGAR